MVGERKWNRLARNVKTQGDTGTYLFDAVFLAGDLGHFGYWFDVLLQTHLQTLAEREVRLGVQRKTKLLRQL